MVCLRGRVKNCCLTLSLGSRPTIAVRSLLGISTAYTFPRGSGIDTSAFEFSCGVSGTMYLRETILVYVAAVAWPSSLNRHCLTTMWQGMLLVGIVVRGASLRCREVGLWGQIWIARRRILEVSKGLLCRQGGSRCTNGLDCSGMHSRFRSRAQKKHEFAVVSLETVGCHSLVVCWSYSVADCCSSAVEMTAVVALCRSQAGSWAVVYRSLGFEEAMPAAQNGSDSPVRWLP
jgi:hypothetical protein